MGKLRFSVHPLFILLGLYFAFSGKVFSFLTFTLVAVIHEYGHYFASSRLGYELNRVSLMPFGAVIRGENQCFSFVDEVKIALAGPIINLATAVVFVAVWWTFPETYPYLELGVTASLAVAVINLIPAFPLDGGRILLSALSLPLKRRTALKIVKVVGIAVALAFIGLFIYSIFTVPNPSLLFFSAFLFAGNVFVSKENDYMRVYSAISVKNLTKGKKIVRVAVNERTLVKDLFAFIVEGSMVDIELVGKNLVLSCEETAALLIEGNIYSTVFKEAERIIKNNG